MKKLKLREIKIPMSEHQLGVYEKARDAERNQEKNNVKTITPRLNTLEVEDKIISIFEEGQFIKISKAGFYESNVHNIDHVIKSK